MSDFPSTNDELSNLVGANTEDTGLPTIVSLAEPQGDDWDDEVESFIGESGSIELPDPNSVVTIRTSGGGDRYVPVTQPAPVKDVIAQSGLFFGGAVQYWLNGAQVNQDTLVPGGSTLSVIGSVKGG